MSNRFSVLNSGTEYSKKVTNKGSGQGHSQSNVTGDKNRQNIFRQKQNQNTQSRNRNDSQNRNRNQNKNQRNSGNQFRRSVENHIKEFKVEAENFPNLSTKTIINIDNDNVNIELTYLEKIIEQKKISQKKNNVPRGWIILTRENLANRARNKKKEDISEYYNPEIAKMIMDNRMQYREELNDILGDISPYWNMQTEIDDEEENDYGSETYSDEDENEYCLDEYW